MKSNLARRKSKMIKKLYFFTLLWFMVSLNMAFAQCLELAEIPMDTQEQSGPGIIMFLMDDSGSMDWEFVTTESNGLYSGDYYLWGDDPGDNNYSYNYPSETEKMQWKRRWSGYNRLYYNPDSTYVPWPRWDSLANTDAPSWTDPVDSTPAHDMDWQNPRSNPIHSGYTINMDDLYYDFSAITTEDILGAGGVIVDNTDTYGEDLVIDNTDSEFSMSGPWSTSDSSTDYGSTSPGYYWTPTSGENYFAAWTFSDIGVGTYDVYAWWTSNSARGTTIDYTINHASGSTVVTVNQRLDGGSWQLLASDVYFDGSASVELNHYCTDSSVDRASADAIKLVPKSVDPPQVQFSSTGTWDFYDANTEYYGSNYQYNITAGDVVSATWTANNLTPGVQYDVYAWWVARSTRSTSVVYNVNHDGGTTSYSANQEQNGSQWVQLAESVTFVDGVGEVHIDHSVTTDEGLTADAVAFVPSGAIKIVNVGNAHYYVQNTSGTYLVNLWQGNFEYYRVDDDNANNNVDAGELTWLTLTEAEAAGIVSGRTYLEERVNFANWYSFYRRRELTAKNAIANVINNIHGVYIGMVTIHERIQQPALPVKVVVDGTYYDQTDFLLDTLYSLNSSSGTPLRLGLKKIGEYFSGNYLKPTTDPPSPFTSVDSYPYFIADKGGSCQQAFCIAMTDGFWNGSSPGVGNADGDNSTQFDGGEFADTAYDTLADVAMDYYERDLNSHLDDVVPMNFRDKAYHQHMVTYTLSFGVNGTLNREEWDNCPFLACPDWPAPSANSTTTIDDLFHAAVNGRGKYVNASSPEELVAALEDLRQDIQSRLGSAAALATNTIQRLEGSMIYQGTYHTDNWSGDLAAMPVDVSDGDIGSKLWSASAELENINWNDRIIVTYDGSDGIPFRHASLSAGQQSLLSSYQVDYLRGDDSMDTAHGGSYRTRSGNMGDIVHSAPFFHRNVVYIGANDGMLHAVDAETGVELFSYVPNLVFDNLHYLSAINYTHKFYVDGTPYVKHMAGQDVLVCGLRRGGKGYFALDVTGVGSGLLTESSMAGQVLWEYSASGDDDLGYSYSRAFIVKTKAEGWVVIFGNGYNSVNEEAVLYILDPIHGTVIRKIHTGVAGCNGMSTPTIIDVEVDGFVDYAYAGDLRGNLWKFDLTGDYSSSWDVAFDNGTGPQPLFQAKNASGEEQPITVAPDVMRHCKVSYGGGYIVVFGTGIYLGNVDFNDTRVQSLYGIWDWQEAWPSAIDPLHLSLGSFTTDRKLSNILYDATFSSARHLTLLEQTVEYDTEEWRVLTQNDINYYNPLTGTGDHVGWYFDLPASRERSVRDPMIRQGVAVMISSLPSNSPCSSGGFSILHQIDACAGGRTEDPQFDLNYDNEFNISDTLDINGDDGNADSSGDGTSGDGTSGDGTSGDGTSGGGEDYFDDNVAPTGKKFDTLLFEATELGDRLYLNDATGNINDVPVPEDPLGMSFWLIVE